MPAFQPPTAIQTTKALIAATQAATPTLTDWTRGSVARSYYEAIAIVQEQQGQQVAQDADATIQLTVQRVLSLMPEPALAAYGIVEFSVSTAPSADTSLPANFVVTIPYSTLLYAVGANIAWPSGTTSVSVVVTCETAGAVGNAPANTITQIVSPVPSGLTGLTVNNPQAFQTGQNAQTLAETTAQVPATLARLKAATDNAVAAAALQATVANDSGYVIEAVMAAVSETGGYVTTPTSTPTVTAVTPTTATSLASGSYSVGYTYTTASGETPISPVSSVTIASGQAIQVDALMLPNTTTTPPSPNSTGINYYLSEAAGSSTVLYAASGTGASITLSALPASGAASPPTGNTAWAQTFGFATCWISNGTGSTASSALVTNAQNLINGYVDSQGIPRAGIKAAGILATVVPAFLSSYNVTLSVLPAPGYTLAMIQDSIQLAIVSYFAGLDIGQSILVNPLILAITNVIGVADITLNQPSENVAGLLGTQYILGTVTLSQMA